jgi:hypothetical protein
MWAVVEVSDGYPNWGCAAERVWVFDNVDDAQAWASGMIVESPDEVFVVKVSEMKVQDAF